MKEAQRKAGAVAPGALVWLLGLTQIIGYGTLYYAFAILADDVANEFGWPAAWIYGAFSVALLAGGIAAPIAGRRIDRCGAPAVMAFGSIAAAIALITVALAPTIGVFLVGLIIIEITSTFVLYNAAFACLVQVESANAPRRITHLTLIAGFASTIFWPLTTGLHTVLTWREVFGFFAISHLVICFPIHFWMMRALKAAPVDRAQRTPETESADTPLPQSVQARAFVLVAIGFSLSGFLLSGILAQMVPMLSAMGLGSTAVLVSTLFGPAQVLVRFVNMNAASARHPLTVTLISSAMLPLAVVALALSAPTVSGAIIFAILLGFGSGLSSIVHGTLPLALFGRVAYGERLGRIASAQLLSNSVAPFVLVFLIENAGPTAALATMIGVGAVGLLAFLAISRLQAISTSAKEPTLASP